MDMIRSKSPFLCLLRIKSWLLTSLKRWFQIVSTISIMCVPMHLRTDDGDGRNEPFSLIIAVQILIAESLDKWLKKSYNTTTLIGWKCESDHTCWPLITIKKSSAPYEATAISLGADLYDHIHDHRHDWSTWRQDATRAQAVIFTVAKRSKKR